MELSNIIRPKIKKGKKRLGKGQGTGFGGTAGKGHKGQRSRSGGKIPNWFEGGQMPIQRRLPKRGFHNVFRKEVRIVNISSLADMDITDFDIAKMEKCGLIPKSKKKQKVPVKVLAKVSPKFNKKLNVKANIFSKSAKKIIEDNGGVAEVVEVG